MTDSSPSDELPKACHAFQEACAERLGRDLDVGDVHDMPEHARGCAACATVVAFLQSAAKQGNEDVELADLASTIDNVVATHHRRLRARIVYRFALGVAAAVVLAVGASVPWYTSSGPNDNRLTLRSGTLVGSDHLQAGDVVAANTAWTVGADGAKIELEDASVVHATRDTKLSILSQNGKQSIRVSSGTLAAAIHTPKALPTRVQTQGVEITVVQARFAIAAFAEETHVDVLEGSISIATEPSAPLTVQAGQSWNRRHRLHVSSQERIFAVEQLFEGSSTVSLPNLGIEDSKIAHPPKAPSSKHTKPLVQANPIDGQALMAKAAQCRGEKDWTCVADAYGTLISHSPRTPKGALALIALADVERMHLGQTARAAKHYARYVHLHPNGPLVLEALVGWAVASRTLGDRQQEIVILTRILREHPTSGPAQQARERLKEYNVKP